MHTTPFDEVQAHALAMMSSEEISACERADAEEEMRLRLAELVYLARAEAGLTQRELARRIGTSQSTVSAFERGARIPTVPTMRRIGRALGYELRVELSEADD